MCLGDRSDDTNEIIECDGCGITVHEGCSYLIRVHFSKIDFALAKKSFLVTGCYGVPDTVSLSSTVSSCSTEPWFCEACRAGIENPTCELCPNSGIVTVFLVLIIIPVISSIFTLFVNCRRNFQRDRRRKMGTFSLRSIYSWYCVRRDGHSQ